MDIIYDKAMLMIGNCYRTQKEASKHIEYWKRIYKDMPEFREIKK